MFQLTPAQEERAQKLYHDSISIDSLGGYSLWTQPMLKALDDAIARGASVFGIMEALEELGKTHMAETDPMFEEARKKSGLTAMSITVGPWGKTMFSYENAIRDLAGRIHLFDRVPHVVKVCSSKDIEQAKKNGDFGIITNFQNTTHIERDLDNIDLFYQFGVRVIQLTYNDMNYVGAGCTERVDGGLSRFGLEVVKALNKRGILIDLSHCGYQTTLDAIEASEVPVAVTHTVCKAVNNHDRGKTDDQLEALAKKNGYCGVCVVPFFISNKGKASLDDWLDHVDHVVKIMGADKVGIGTDWGGNEPPALAKKMDEEAYPKIGFRPEHKVDSMARTEGYYDWTEWSNFARALVSRGYRDDEVKGILGGNFLRIFKQVVG